MAPDERMLLLNLFSDETLLSRFSGGSSLYPVILWSSSLPQADRKRGTPAAPTVVAFLPIVRPISLLVRTRLLC